MFRVCLVGFCLLLFGGPSHASQTLTFEVNRGSAPFPCEDLLEDESDPIPPESVRQVVALQQFGQLLGRALPYLKQQATAMARPSARRLSSDFVADLVQETVLKALQIREYYDGNRPFQPWLYWVLKRTYSEKIRKVVREPLFDDITAMGSASSDRPGAGDTSSLPPSLIVNPEQELSAELNPVLEKMKLLPRLLRDALIETVINGKSIQEAAILFDISPREFTVRLGLARTTLKRLIESPQTGSAMDSPPVWLEDEKPESASGDSSSPTAPTATQALDGEIFRSWLLTMQRHYDAAQRPRIEENLELRIGVPTSSLDWNTVETSDPKVIDIVNRINRLTVKRRHAFLLFCIANYSEKDLATILQIPVTTLKGRIQAAREGIRLLDGGVRGRGNQYQVVPPQAAKAEVFGRAEDDKKDAKKLKIKEALSCLKGRFFQFGAPSIQPEILLVNANTPQTEKWFEIPTEQCHQFNAVYAAINEISPNARHALLLFEVARKSYRDIAVMMNVEESTVLGRLQTARTLLSRALEK
jgi:RNA polymerase sigma factor (sigma-70 family)